MSIYDAGRQRQECTLQEPADLGVRSEASERVSANCHDFEAHGVPTQRGIGAIWAAVPQGELRRKIR